MPLLRFDLIAGRTDGELKDLLDAAHRAIVEAFGVPERDRYQIVHEHRVSRIVVEDTGLDIPHTDKTVFLKAPAASARRSKRRTSTASSVRSLRKPAASVHPTWWCRSSRMATRIGRSD